MTRVLLLFHNNLRINDNSLLEWAANNKANVCGLVITNKVSKSPQHRFYLESVQELQRDVQPWKTKCRRRWYRSTRSSV